MTWDDAEELLAQREAMEARSRRLRGGLRSLLRRAGPIPGRGQRSEVLRGQIAETEQRRQRLDDALVREVPRAGVRP